MASTDKKKVKITETSKQANVDIISETIQLPADSSDHTLVAKVPSAANCTSGVNVEVEMSPDGTNWCPALRKETVTTPGSTTAQIIGNEKFVDLQKNAPVYNSYAKGGLNFDINGNEVSLGTGVRDLLDQHIAVNKSFNHSMWIKSDTLPDIARDETVSFTVTVAGGKFYINGNLQSTVYLKEGSTYTFNQSDSSNSGHPLRLSTTSNGSHDGGSEYTTGVTTVGTPGTSGAYTQIVVATGAPTLYYYCTQHSGMGGTAETPVNKPYNPVLFRHGGYDNFENTKVVRLQDNDPSGTPIENKFKNGAIFAKGAAGATFNETYYNSTSSWTHAFWVKGQGANTGSDWGLHGAVNQWFANYVRIQAGVYFDYSAQRLAFTWLGAGINTNNVIYSGTVTGSSVLHPGETNDEFCSQWFLCVATHDYNPTTGTQVFNSYMYTEDGRSWAGGTTNATRTSTAVTYNGRTIDGNGGSGGDVCQYFIWDKALSSSEVSDLLRTSPLGGNNKCPEDPTALSTASNLIGWYTFGDDASDTATSINNAAPGSSIPDLVTSGNTYVSIPNTESVYMNGPIRSTQNLSDTTEGDNFKYITGADGTTTGAVPDWEISGTNKQLFSLSGSGMVAIDDPWSISMNVSFPNSSGTGKYRTFFSMFTDLPNTGAGIQLVHYRKSGSGSYQVLRIGISDGTYYWARDYNLSNTSGEFGTLTVVKNSGSFGPTTDPFTVYWQGNDVSATGASISDGAVGNTPGDSTDLSWSGHTIDEVHLSGYHKYFVASTTLVKDSGLRKIDNVACYPFALSSTQAALLHNSPLNTTSSYYDPNLISGATAIFRMGDGANDINDEIFDTKGDTTRKFVKGGTGNETIVNLSTTDNIYYEGPPTINSLLNISSPFSISGWFKTTATGTLLSNRDSSQGLKIEITHSGLTVTHNSTTVNYNNVGSVKDGQWHHFCLRKYANNNYNLLIDNVGAGNTYQLAQANTDWQGSNGFTLLSDGDNNAKATNPANTDASKLNADLSNWSIHSEALSNEAIAQLYSNGHVRNIKNLPSVDANSIKAWWQLNDSTNPQNDISGNNYHLQFIDRGIAKDKALKTVGDGANLSANCFEITGINKNPWAEASSNTILSLDPDTSNNAQGGLGVTMQIKCEAGVTPSSDFSRKNLLYVKLTNGKFMEMFLEKRTTSNDLVFVLFMSDTASISSSNTSGAIASFSAGTGLDDGNWHHFTINITDDSSDLFNATRIYIDGSLATQTSHPWSGYSNGSFTGVVDEVVILGNVNNSSGNNLDMDITIDNLGFFTGYYHNNHFDSTAAGILYNNRNDLSYPTLDASNSSDQPVMTAIFEMGDRNGDVTSPNSAISLKDEILPAYRAITPQASLHADSGVVTLSSTEDPYSASGGATNTDLSTKLIDATGPTLVEKSINGNAMTLSITKNFNFTTSKWVKDASGDAALCLSLNGFEAQAEYFALWKCAQTLPDGAVDVCDGNWHNIALSYRGQNDLAGNNVAEGDAARFGRGSADNPFNWSLAIDGYPIYTEITNNTGADYIGGLNTLLTDTINSVTYNVGFNIYNRHLKYDPNNTEEEYRVHGQFGAGVHTYLTNETDPHVFRGEVDETSFHTDSWWVNPDGSDIGLFGSDSSKKGNLFNQEKTYTLYGRTSALDTRGLNKTPYAQGIPYPLLNPELLKNSGNITDIVATNQFLNPVRKGDTQPWNSQVSTGGLEGWWRWGDTAGDCSLTVNDVKDHNSTPAVDYRDIDAVELTDQGSSSNVVLANNESIYLQSQASSTSQGTAGTQFNQIKLENLSALVGSAACTVKDFVSPVLQYLRIKLTGTGTCDIGEGKLEIEVNHKKRRMK